MTRTMIDASDPAAAAYSAGFDAFGFYIGGNTPHVWTDAEVAAIKSRYLVPILTRSAGGDPVADAAHTAAWCRAHRQPAGTLTALDFEGRQDAAYVRAYDAAVLAAGWRTALYGQKSTVLGNPRPSGGYWVAWWDTPAVLDDPAWTGKQYLGEAKIGKPYDLSVVNDTAPLWDTRPAVDPPAKARRNDMHVDLKLNRPVVFTNPAAVLGGGATMALSADFGASTVRVATYSFKTGHWTVANHDVSDTGGAVSLPLPADVNKVSLVVLNGNDQWPVAVDVFA